MSTIPNSPASEIACEYLRLHYTEGVGPIKLNRLLDHFGDIEGIFDASITALQRVEGIGKTTAEAIFNTRNNEKHKRELDRAAQLGLRILCPLDEDYPSRLKTIPDAPICLYVRGQLKPEDVAGFGMVGTRRCTHYGREQALRFAGLLVGAGFTIMSGLARGIDGAAHEGALKANGRTIAVLGNGLASIYPPEHAELAEHITENGAILSEIPIDSAPDKNNFSRRNRIIAGLSAGVLVVEAGHRSGARITARYATEDYNREVFAIPGRIDNAYAAGTNEMIRDGQAKLVTSLEDILDELKTIERKQTQKKTPEDLFAEAPTLPPPNLNETEEAVLQALGSNETHIETICRTTGLPVHKVTSCLMTLQLKSLVRQLPGDHYLRR